MVALPGLVEHYVRDVGVAGSNPVIETACRCGTYLRNRPQTVTCLRPTAGHILGATIVLLPVNQSERRV
jgi:hypothetical protein